MQWAQENILPTTHGDHAEAEALAEQCLADAALDGIDLDAVREIASGDLPAYMLQLLNHLADEELKRLVGRGS